MIDLHMHSLYSDDGEFTPQELVDMCARQGVEMMSIADHNTVRGTEEAIKAARRAGVIYIPGIEIDCVFRETNFHVLGYGIDHQAPAFGKIEENVRTQGRAASRQMLKKTRELGLLVTEEEMTAMAEGGYWQESWTGEMFAELLLSKAEYTDHPLLKPYRPGGERSDNPYVNFYWDFYSQGKPCHAPMHYPAMEEVLDIIHENRGLAVLAHPHINIKGDHSLVTDIIRLGIDGIEVFSSYHTPSQIAESLADVKGNPPLIATCGSDFHGKTKPSIQLGAHGCTLSDAEMKVQLGRIMERHF